jgi:hypothetical protein
MQVGLLTPGGSDSLDRLVPIFEAYRGIEDMPTTPRFDLGCSSILFEKWLLWAWRDLTKRTCHEQIRAAAHSSGVVPLGPEVMSNAEANGHRVVEEMADLGIAVRRIEASAAGGLAIWTCTGRHYALVECYDEGDMAVLWNHPSSGLENWVIEQDRTWSESFHRLLAFQGGTSGR